jgi:lysophospholipase L1-like esterase
MALPALKRPGAWTAGLLLLAAAAASAEPPVIVLLGDSTTAGTPGFRSPREAPPEGEGNPRSQYGWWIAERHPEWRVVNQGIRGQRSDEILARFEADAAALAPKAVVILAGVNDLHQYFPPELLQRNLAALYDRAAEKGILAVACTILPYDQARPEVAARIREVNAWIRAEAARRRIPFCDTAAAVENPARPGRLRGSPDGKHPDPDGYRRMGEAVLAALETALAPSLQPPG